MENNLYKYQIISNSPKPIEWDEYERNIRLMYEELLVTQPDKEAVF